MKTPNLQFIQKIFLIGCFYLFVISGTFAQSAYKDRKSLTPDEVILSAPVEQVDATRVKPMNTVINLQEKEDIPAWIISGPKIMNDDPYFNSKVSSGKNPDNLQEIIPLANNGLKSSGNFTLTDYSQRIIVNQGTGLYIFYTSEEIPPNAEITNVELYTKIDDNGNANAFYPRDYEIYVGTQYSEVCVYDNLGYINSHTDEGYDDDAEYDSDIYLYYRDFDDFDGEAVSQYYSVRVVDNFAGGEGKVSFAALRICWSAPYPNLVATYIPECWEAPLIMVASPGSHSHAPIIYAGIEYYFTAYLMNCSYEIPDDYDIEYYISVDGSRRIVGYREGMAAGEDILIEDTYGYTFTAGEHTICQAIDYDNHIWWESDETDNEYCRTITCIGLPDWPVLLSPSNGVTCQPTALTISWEESANATLYHVFVDDNSDYSSPLVYEVISGTSRYVSGLTPNTTYYWKVQAENPAGLNPYSFARYFTTAPDAPVPPALVSPADGSTCETTTKHLDWSSVTNASTYNLQVDDNSNFSSPLIEQNGLTEVWSEVSGLSEGTTYYWRVSAVNSCGTASSWSSARKFTTLSMPGVPLLSIPSNDGQCQALSLTLSWKSVAEAISYDIWVDDYNDFDSRVIELYDYVGTSVDISGLNASTRYYWVVRSTNNCDVSSYWSETWAFNTVGAVPGTASPSSPSDGETCQPVTITLEWSAGSGAGTYTLQVDNNGDFSSPVFNQGSISSTSKEVSGLSNGTTYYWRVKSVNACGIEAAWSAINSFTTATYSYPAGPELTSPADGATCQSTSPVLSWNSVAGAVNYGLQIDDDLYFSDAEYYPECEGTSFSINDLLENTLYYWRMHSTGACGDTGSWSDTLSFLTGINGMNAPSLVQPADNSTDEPISLTLTWEAVTDAASYQFQLDDNENFTSPLYNEEVSGTSKYVTTLDSGANFYWHIRANGDCSASDWSDTWKFTTESGTGPDALTDAKNTGYYLGQNYPNPFTGVTVLEFSLPVESQVRLEFMDMQGKLIELFEGHYTAGTHSVEINLDGKVRSGVYLYRMKTNDYTDTRICILR